MAIIGGLVALLLPAVQAARESARRTHCLNNLRQIGVALASYESQRHELPIGCLGCIFRPATEDRPFVPQRFHSWNSQLLPWLEQESHFKRLRFDLKTDEEPNKSAGAEILTVFLCPSTLEPELRNWTGKWRGAAFTDYGGLYGVEGEGHDADDPAATQHLRDRSLGVFVYDEPVRYTQVDDGLSNTASVAEMLLRRRTECEWINGNNVFAQEGRTPLNSGSGLGNDIGSPHPGGACVLYGDGRQEFLSNDISQSVLNALITREGND